jgi:hypothetical protein
MPRPYEGKIICPTRKCKILMKLDGRKYGRGFRCARLNPGRSVPQLAGIRSAVTSSYRSCYVELKGLLHELAHGAPVF